MSRTSSRIALVATVVVICTGIWYWQAPRRAWNNMVKALAFQDAPALERLVDFASVRAHLKTDLRTAMAASTPGGAMAAAIGGVGIDPVVDIIVTPAGMAQLVNTFGTRDTTAAQHTVVRYRYRGVSHVDVHIRSSVDRDDAAGIFTLERSGARWRLVRIWSDRLATSAESR